MYQCTYIILHICVCLGGTGRERDHTWQGLLQDNWDGSSIHLVDPDTPPKCTQIFIGLHNHTKPKKGAKLLAYE